MDDNCNMCSGTRTRLSKIYTEDQPNSPRLLFTACTPNHLHPTKEHRSPHQMNRTYRLHKPDGVASKPESDVLIEAF